MKSISLLLDYASLLREDDNPANWYLKGQRHYLEGWYSTALSFYDKAINLIKTQNSSGIYKYYTASNAYIQDAIKLRQKDITTKVNLLELMLAKSYILNELGKYKEALDCVDSLLRIEESNAAWRCKGKVFYKQGNYQEAIECYNKWLIAKVYKEPRLEEKRLYKKYEGKERKLSEKEDKVEAICAIAEANIKLGREEKALENLNQAIEISSVYSEAYHLKGSILEKYGKRKEANENYAKVFNIYAKNANNDLDYEKTINYLDEALKLNPNFAEAWNNKACVIYDKPPYNKAAALECFDKALLIDSKFVEAWENKGDTLFRMKLYQKALGCYKKALELNPNNTTIKSKKKETLTKLGKSEEAINSKSNEAKVEDESSYKNTFISYEQNRSYYSNLEERHEALKQLFGVKPFDYTANTRHLYKEAPIEEISLENTYKLSDQLSIVCTEEDLDMELPPSPPIQQSKPDKKYLNLERRSETINIKQSDKQAQITSSPSIPQLQEKVIASKNAFDQSNNSLRSIQTPNKEPSLYPKLVSSTQSFMQKKEDNIVFAEEEIAKGDLFSSKYEYKEAIECYDKVIQQRPNYAPVYRKKGLALSDLGQYEEAEKYLDIYIKLEPKSSFAYFAKGINLCDLEKYEEAVICYNTALELKPNFSKAYLKKGITLLKLSEKNEEAVKCFDKCIELDPKDTSAYLWKGMALLFSSSIAVLYKVEKIEEALKNFDKVIKLYPKALCGYLFKGKALIDLKEIYEAIKCNVQYIELSPDPTGYGYNESFGLQHNNIFSAFEAEEEVIKFYNKYLKQTPTEIDVYNNLGLSLSAIGKYEEAIICYNRALELDPNSSKYYLNKGIIFYKLNKKEEALKLYNKALELNPENAVAYMKKGEVLNILGDKLEATKCYTKYKELIPNYTSETFNSFGNSKILLGLERDALECYDEAIRLLPNYSEAYLNKSLALNALGRLEEAIQWCNKAMALDPYNAACYYNKGSMLYELGKEDEALINYDKSIKLNSNDGAAYYKKAEILKVLGKLKEAIPYYDKCIELNTDYAEAYLQKAIVLNDLGEKEKSIEMYDKYIELNPKSAIAYYYKGILLHDLGQEWKAIKCYDEAIYIGYNFPNIFHAKGQALYAAGNDRAAIECFNKAIELNGNYVEAYLSKVKALTSLSEYLEVIETYNRYLELFPNSSFAYWGKGRALSFEDKYTEALQCYNKAIDLNPVLTEAYFDKARTLFILAEKPKAKIFSNEDIETESEQNIRYFGGNKVLYDLVKIKEAIGTFDKYIELDPASLTGYYYKALALFHLKMNDEAIIHFDKCIELSPEESDIYLTKCYVLFELDMVEEAIKSYVKYRELSTFPIFLKEYQHDDFDFFFGFDDPVLSLVEGYIKRIVKFYNHYIASGAKDADTYYSLGVLFSDLQEQTVGIECFNEAIKLNPSVVKAYLSKAKVLCYLKKYEESIECFNKAIQTDPTCAIAFNDKGKVFNELGQREEALRCFKEAIELDPQCIIACYNKKNTSRALGKNGESEEECSKRFSELLKQSKAEYNYSLGNSSLLKRHLKEAIKYYDKAIDLCPTYAEAYHNKGKALIALGWEREAIECYDKAILLNSSYAKAYISKGNILYMLGQAEEAIEYYNLATKHDSINPLYHFIKGKTLASLGKEQEALASFSKAYGISQGTRSELNKNIISYLNNTYKLDNIEELSYSLKNGIKQSEVMDKSNIIPDIKTSLQKKGSFPCKSQEAEEEDNIILDPKQSNLNNIHGLQLSLNSKTEELKSCGHETIMEHGKKLEAHNKLIVTIQETAKALDDQVKEDRMINENIADKMQHLADSSDVENITSELTKLITEGRVTRGRLVDIEEDIDELIVRQSQVDERLERLERFQQAIEEIKSKVKGDVKISTKDKLQMEKQISYIAEKVEQLASQNDLEAITVEVAKLVGEARITKGRLIDLEDDVDELLQTKGLVSDNQVLEKAEVYINKEYVAEKVLKDVYKAKVVQLEGETISLKQRIEDSVKAKESLVKDIKEIQKLLETVANKSEVEESMTSKQEFKQLRDLLDNALRDKQDLECRIKDLEKQLKPKATENKINAGGDQLQLQLQEEIPDIRGNKAGKSVDGVIWRISEQVTVQQEVLSGMAAYVGYDIYRNHPVMPDSNPEDHAKLLGGRDEPSLS
ncbi:MAG: Tetratricopeptide 1 repeat-containing protein [Rickettsiaceae bacterium]|nr:Tetratricopeptide 1 repeat-containing protein [Rickettsiaceae bacterium]